MCTCAHLSVCVTFVYDPICSSMHWVTSFHHHIRGTIPLMYLSTPLQESSDVFISGLRSELSSLNQKLEEMTSYHQVTLKLLGWVPVVRNEMELPPGTCTCNLWPVC